jgi:hypothetical protein
MVHSIKIKCTNVLLDEDIVCNVGGMRSGVINEYTGDRRDSCKFLQRRFGDRRISAARSAKECSHLAKLELERSQVRNSVNKSRLPDF